MEKANDTLDAQRWRHIAARFNATKISVAQRILDDLGYDQIKPHEELEMAVDAAMREEKASITKR